MRVHGIVDKFRRWTEFEGGECWSSFLRKHFRFSDYESFGEWVYRIEMKEVNRTNVSRERKDDLHAID